MTSRIFTSAALLAAFCGTLPAVDPNLLSLAMPDAVAMADINVASAKGSLFGQYVLSQMTGNSGFATATATLGFDPSQDLIEVFVCSNGTPKTGLVLATGTFNTSAISTAATSATGGTSEKYNGVVIFEDPAKEHGFAFLGSSVAVAGDIPDVKAAIDRQGKAPGLSQTIQNQIGALSNADDAWFLTTVPPATLNPKAGTLPGMPGNTAATILQQVQAASGGVKFQGTVQFTAQVQADSAQDATSMAGMLQLLANLAQANSSKNPEGAAALKNLTVSASGTAVNIALTLPEDQFQQLFAKPAHIKKAAARK